MSHPDLPNHSTLCHVLHILVKLLMSRGALTWFETFWSYGGEAIDYWTIFQWKLNKIETEKFIRIWGRSWCCWKALVTSNLIKIISQFSELRCGRYWFLIGFCYWKFKKIAKIGFERKNELTLRCVHIAEFKKFQILKMWKIKNVFTLGPTSQVTLVTMK